MAHENEGNMKNEFFADYEETENASKSASLACSAPEVTQKERDFWESFLGKKLFEVTDDDFLKFKNINQRILREMVIEHTSA